MNAQIPNEHGVVFIFIPYTPSVSFLLVCLFLLGFCLFVCLFETGSHYIALTSLELVGKTGWLQIFCDSSISAS